MEIFHMAAFANEMPFAYMSDAWKCDYTQEKNFHSNNFPRLIIFFKALLRVFITFHEAIKKFSLIAMHFHGGNKLKFSN
jgi:hypothetical protein